MYLMMREDDCFHFFIIKVAGKRVVDRDLQGAPHTGGREGEAWVYGPKLVSQEHRTEAPRDHSCVLSEKCLVVAGGCLHHGKEISDPRVAMKYSSKTQELEKCSMR